MDSIDQNVIEVTSKDTSLLIVIIVILALWFTLDQFKFIAKSYHLKRRNEDLVEAGAD